MRRLKIFWRDFRIIVQSLVRFIVCVYVYVNRKASLSFVKRQIISVLWWWWWWWWSLFSPSASASRAILLVSSKSVRTAHQFLLEQRLTTWWMIWFLVSLVERPVATQLHERQSLVFFFLCSRYSKQTSLSRSLPNLPGRLQMGCNTKVKLLIYELFRRGEGIQKGHFRFGTSFTKCKLAAKLIYLLKK